MERRNFLKLALAGAGAASLTAATGCGLTGGAAASGDKTIKIIATESAPYQEPTKIAAELLKAKGWTLEATYVTDIIQPNLAVSNGEFDANYFQHGAYLQQFNVDQLLEVQPLFYVYGSPAGIWSKRYSSLQDLPDGARIALPVDPANNGRGLVLLRDAGLLELKEGVGVIHTSQETITANPKNFEFVEVDQQSLSKTLPDVDAGVLFVRLAAEIGLSPDDALAFEKEADQIPFRCVVAGTAEFAETEKAKALQEAYQSPEVREWFAGYMHGVLPTPWDADPLEDLSSWWEA
ncbi:MetQ/NlpA family ABC transporter substrate-binding protein [Arthrobacter sp. zg-Y916]|uniref:MetQ/NlpA family ABC transporter substrate-binding protein n=1 Tax=Arthrobacter sp. zg-Y916 TaxID=2894190 RepID=UPI001E40197E|nr:MetQ/NlpA family ABC transporter substrate-binding protein [Arthrobacter sp. zg-Y916]MCC9194976.1 MetQ/NlpA family ABC transporter substrate-binding protein [Arthrobacter sp. zg-Y916]